MLIVSTLALLAAFGLAAAPACAGPLGFQASAGYYTETEDAFVGAGLRVGLGGITVIPNAEWQFPENGSAYNVYVDGTLNLLFNMLYAGGGIGWTIVDPENFDSETDTVYDVLAGVGFDAVPLKPFGQVKWVIADGDDPISISAGIRF
jgi:hypothetical protein